MVATLVALGSLQLHSPLICHFRSSIHPLSAPSGDAHRLVVIASVLLRCTLPNVAGPRQLPCGRSGALLPNSPLLASFWPKPLSQPHNRKEEDELGGLSEDILRPAKTPEAARRYTSTSRAPTRPIPGGNLLKH